MEYTLPNFLCVGVGKAGTISLADMLREHPDVFIPEQKELCYFSSKNYKKII